MLVKFHIIPHIDAYVLDEFEMINGLLFVIGIIGVTEYLGKPDLKLFGVKFLVGHWTQIWLVWTHQDSS